MRLQTCVIADIIFSAINKSKYKIEKNKVLGGQFRSIYSWNKNNLYKIASNYHISEFGYKIIHQKNEHLKI